MSFCNFRKCRNISDIHHGVGWSFNINCFCVFVYITFHIFFPTVDSGKMDPIFRRNIVKKPDASAVQVCIYDQMVSWFKQLHYQSDCCHSSGKSQCIDSVFQSCYNFFQMLSGRVLQSAVVKACALAYCRMLICCCLINRKTDRAIIVTTAFLFFQM